MYEMDYQLESYLNDCTAKQLRPKTIKSYVAAIRLFSDYMINTHQINTFSKVTQTHITDYIKFLQDRGKYSVVTCADDINHPKNRTDYGKEISVTTINGYLRDLRAFFNYLKENHDIRKNPMDKVKTLNDDRKPLEFISDDAFMNLLTHMDKSKFSEYRDFNIVMTLLDTGMRIGECLLIKTEQVDFIRKSIFIPFENTKLLLDNLIQQLYVIASVPSSVIGQGNIANVSEVSLKLLFSQTDNKAKQMMQVMKEGIFKRFDCFRNVLGNTYSNDIFDSLDIKFSVNRPVDTSSLMSDLKTQYDMGAISKQTVIDLSPYSVDTPLEMERIQQENNSTVSKE